MVKVERGELIREVQTALAPSVHLRGALQFYWPVCPCPTRPPFLLLLLLLLPPLLSSVHCAPLRRLRLPPPALGMADQYVAVKKPVSPCLSSSSPHPAASSHGTTNERTNDQRNVNRKPREATLINPTEINCAVQRRSLAFSPPPFPSPLPSSTLRLCASSVASKTIRSPSLRIRTRENFFTDPHTM